METESVRGLFIGVGVDHYTSPDLPTLAFSVDEVTVVSELVGDHFDVRLLCDASHAKIQHELRERANHYSEVDGAAVLMWSGHGISGVGPHTLRLLAHDSRNEPGEGFDPVEVATRCAATGAHQVLLIIDTCYAGNAIETVAHIAKYFRENPPAGEWSWFGLLASCGPEKVREHQLGPQLQRLLRDGPHPDGPHADELRRRWSTHQRYLRGDDLADALVKQWDPGAASSPEFSATGDARPFLRNPLWSPAAGPLLVDEVLTGVQSTSVFYGRQTAVATLAGWIAERRCGVYAITGEAGSGKSALLRHALTGPAGGGASPRDPAAAVIVDVRGLSAALITEAVDSLLVSHGFLRPVAGSRTTSELCRGLQQRRDSGDSVPVIALDSLAGAIDPAQIVHALLTPLSAVAAVVVATRPAAISVPRQRRVAKLPLVAAAGETEDLVSIAAAAAPPEHILDLDSAEHRRSGWDALVEMFDDQVPADAPDRDPAGTVAALRRHASEQSPPPFVLAKLLLNEARQTGARGPLTAGNAEDSLGAALDHLVTGAYDPAALPVATVLLRTLPYGFGAGLPEREWLVAANAIRPPGTAPLSRVDVAATLAPLGAYIVEDAESDEAVYRFAHSLIAQHYVENDGVDGHSSTAAVTRIASALVSDAQSPAGSGSAHLARYLWRYVAQAGEAGLDLLRGNDALSADLAAAALAVSIRTAAEGNVSAGVRLAEEAVAVAERLAGEVRSWQLAPALAHLATLYQSQRQVTKAVEAGHRAVEAYNELVTTRPEVVANLAASAHNLANMLMDAQDSTASTVAQQVVDLEKSCQQQGADNRYRLGIAQNTLALALSMEGRIADAVQASRHATETLQVAVNDAGTESDRAALAQSLQNLGSHLAENGAFVEAVAVTERARDIMETLAAANPTWVLGLLETLSDLGARYSQIGYVDLAVGTAARAADGYRAPDSLTAKQMANHAGALTNYANVLIVVDRAEAALLPARQAVDIMQGLADNDEANKPALAQMLDNYANALSLTGHHSEALEASTRALQHYQIARGGNLGLDNDVARVLFNHCQRLAACGRPAEAAEAGTKAIALFEQLAAGAPHNHAEAVSAGALVAMFTVAAGDKKRGMHLAAKTCERGEQLLSDGIMSADDLATVYVQSAKAAQSDSAAAMRYAQRTVDLMRQAGSPDTSNYGVALRNLAACHGMAGQTATGLEAVGEAEEVWNRLLSIDSSQRGGLASALSTKASLLLDLRNVAAAREAAVASIEHYTMIPELHPHDMETCGRTLATLARTLGSDVDTLDEHVNRCLRARDGVTRAQLLFYGVTVLPEDHPRVPHWLHTAMHELGSENPMLLLHLRRATRMFRAAGRARFDQMWKRAAGTDLPVWATIDDNKVDLAMQWISAPGYSSAEAFLRSNSQLLDADCDTAVEEVFPLLDQARAAALADLRNRIRFAAPTDAPGTGGAEIEDAGPLNIYDLAEQFLAADLDGQITLLAVHGEELRDGTVRRHLLARNGHPRQKPSVSLLELSRLGLHTAVATAAASGDTDQVDTLLARIAEEQDLKALRQAAFAISHHANATANAAVGTTASFYFGVGLLGVEEAAQGRNIIALAAEGVPGRVPAWLTLSDRLAPTKPEFGEAATILDPNSGGDRG